MQKDPLIGDKNIFEGKWNWKYTVHTWDQCDPDVNFEEYIYPSDVGKTYAVEFVEKGKIHFYEGGQLKIKNRIIFDKFIETSPDVFYFSIKLNNKEDDRLSGTYYGDSISTFSYPKYIYDRVCEDYFSYFIRE